MGRVKARDGLVGVATGVVAFVVMGVVSAVGLALLGVGSGDLLGQAVAVVASAVGSPVALAPALPQGASLDVRLHVVATGITVIGVLVLVLGFRWKRGPETLAGAVTSFPVLLGVLTAVTGGGVLSADPMTSALLAVLGVVGVWAVGRGPAVLRPALSATVLVLGGAALLATAAGVVVARVQDARAVGAVLLAAPSALFAAITAGLGVDWSVDADPRVTRMLGGVLPELPSIDLPTWPFTVLAVVLLLVCGVLTAVRTAGSATDPTDLVLRCAAALGLVFAAASAAMVVTASASVDLRVSARAFVLLDTTAGASGSVWTAVPLGLVAGAVAGAVGALLLVAVHRGDGTYPGPTGAGKVFGGAADGVQGTPRAARGPAAGGRGRPDAAGTARGEPAVRGVRGCDGGRRSGGAGTGRP